MRAINVLAIVVSSLVVSSVTVVGTASAVRVVPPRNPNANVAARPEYTFPTGSARSYSEGSTLPACWRWGSNATFVPQATTPTCVRDELAATNHARRVEGVGAMTLPRNYAHLTVPEQLFVLVNLERVGRGEAPVLGLSRTANLYAQRGARANADPLLPASDNGIAGATGAWDSNYAGSLSALDANYDWMYLDGWQGTSTVNYDCTSANANGCWGHRDNILTNASRVPCDETACALVMGAGVANNGAGHSYSAYSELLIQVAGATPALYYTWSSALAAGASG